MIAPVDLLALETPRREARPVGRPLMRYFGGKWLLAPWVIEHFPKHRIYVESFGGAASVLLRKERAFSEVYNDIDGEVVNLFRVLQDLARYRDLMHLLRFTPYARQELELAFIKTDNSVERARRLLIRSWMGYGTNGAFRVTGFRTNVKKPRRSTPARDWNNVINHLDVIVDRLRGVNIENRPAIDVMQGHDTNETLFYVDPPYPRESRNRPDERYRHEMTDDDHRDLAQCLHHLEGMVILSTYPSSLYQELYAGWERVEREHYADGHDSRRVEVLWLSPSVTRARQKALGPLFAGLVR